MLSEGKATYEIRFLVMSYEVGLVASLESRPVRYRNVSSRRMTEIAADGGNKSRPCARPNFPRRLGGLRQRGHELTHHENVVCGPKAGRTAVLVTHFRNGEHVRIQRKSHPVPKENHTFVVAFRQAEPNHGDSVVCHPYYGVPVFPRQPPARSGGRPPSGPDGRAFCRETWPTGQRQKWTDSGAWDPDHRVRVVSSSPHNSNDLRLDQALFQ
jgi:hypothetical protein